MEWQLSPAPLPVSEGMTASQAVLAIQQEIKRDLAKEQQVTSFVTSSGRAMVFWFLGSSFLSAFELLLVK